MCAPTKLKFPFEKEDRFLMLFQTCTKLTFGLSVILVITVIARNRINSVGSLFFRGRILRFGNNMPRMLLLYRGYKGGLLERGFLERVFLEGFSRNGSIRMGFIREGFIKESFFFRRGVYWKGFFREGFSFKEGFFFLRRVF